MTESQHVLFEELPAGPYRVGLATLNAPRKLNALGLDMIEPLDAQLARWQADPELVAVILRGAGDKAFCAGGDIRQVAEAIRGHRAEEEAFAERYFPSEYRLDYRIHTYPKPLLIWGDGIVMGGGIGLMSGGSHRIVTPRSLLAMPEITIGLFPDVGASWFLNRMPGRAGLYLGLTGARFNGADALHLGLADHALPEGSWETLLEGLQGVAWSARGDADRDRVTDLLRELGTDCGEGLLRPRLDTLQPLLGYEEVTRLAEVLERNTGGDDYLAENAQRLLAGSPTSAHVIHEQLRRARYLSLAECFRMEADMVVQFTRRHDFPEGVRALLVDKDNRPDWQPGSLEAVEPDWVAAHFASPWSDGGPLQNLGR